MLELTINNFSGNDVSSFIELVKQEIKDRVSGSLSQKQLSRVTEYLNSELSPYYTYLHRFKNTPTLYADEIFQGALNNLEYSNTNNKVYKIFINPSKYIPNTSISYESVVALITNGNLVFNPYRIFSEKLEQIDREIPQLFEDYVEERL